MTPHKQLLRHDPENGIWGDCHRTCYACLLDIEPADVPHFCDNDASDIDASKAIEAWLAGRGLAGVCLAFDCDLKNVLLTFQNLNPTLFYILGGYSKSGVGHSVIALGGKIIHDPSLNNSGIVGPHDDGYFWTNFIIPLSQVSTIKPVYSSPKD